MRIIILHCHPSGNPIPSTEDRIVEEKLSDAGELLGVSMMDFLIIGEDGRFWSARDGDDRVKSASLAEDVGIDSCGGDEHE